MNVSHTAASLLVGLLLSASLFVGTGGASAEDVTHDITYSVGASGIEIRSANATVLISNSTPAASVRAGDLTNLTGDGFILRSFIGYNASADNGFSPDLIEFRAPTNRSVWTVTGPEVSETSQGKIVSVELGATLDMIQVGGTGGGGPAGTGSGGPAYVIHNWASVTVRFMVSTYNFSSTYQGIPQSPTYSVNGSSELKFDVGLIALKPLPVDSLALEVALMKMDDASYTPSASYGSYGFRGSQANGRISESDPYVNETQGSTLVIHSFEDREQLKQSIEFTNDSGVMDGYFSWASQARTGATSGVMLTNVTAYYRTDGESLVVYLSTPVTADTITIDHDPSVGVFGAGIIVPVRLPGTDTLGSSVLSILIGVAVGAVVGGVGVYALSARHEDQDPADPVLLEKNRYYRKR